MDGRAEIALRKTGAAFTPSRFYQSNIKNGIMKRRIMELNKEIEKLTHARNALRILKYSAWGGMPLKEDKALMDDIKNLDRKFADEINGYLREIEEIERDRFADMYKERQDFICNHMCNGCKSREMNRLNNCTTLQVYMDCYSLGLADALDKAEIINR